VSPLLRRRDATQDAPPIPARPYRDTAILHGVLGTVLFVAAVFTGTDLAKSALVAAGYFAAATAWSWWRFSQRIRASRAAAAEAAGRDAERGS
jgi:hypothetical protein